MLSLSRMLSVAPSCYRQVRCLEKHVVLRKTLLQRETDRRTLSWETRCCKERQTGVVQEQEHNVHVSTTYNLNVQMQQMQYIYNMLFISQHLLWSSRFSNCCIDCGCWGVGSEHHINVSVDMIMNRFANYDVESRFSVNQIQIPCITWW